MSTTLLDAGALRDHIRAMYRDVARYPAATSTSRPAAPSPSGSAIRADWLDAVPAEALASFAGVGHMLDLAAIEPGDDGPRPRVGLRHRRVHRRAPDGPGRAA